MVTGLRERKSREYPKWKTGGVEGGRNSNLSDSFTYGVRYQRT